jgi:MSHA biogenesis protein MshL
MISVKLLKKFCIALLALCLVSCANPAKYEAVTIEVLDEIQDEFVGIQEATSASRNDSAPENILQALVPGLTLDSDVLQPVEERFDFVIQDPLDVREFFTLLTEGTDFSIAVHPAIEGTVSSLDLKNVTLEEALEQVSTLYGFALNKSGDVYQVLPGGMQTRIFKIDYLNVNRQGNSNMQITSIGISQSGGQGNSNGSGQNSIAAQTGSFGGGGQGGQGAGGLNSGGASINTTTDADYWEELESIILDIVNANPAPATSLFGALGASGEQRSVIVSPHTGMIVVRAFPNELDQIADFLEQSQSALQRQVVLEAKILEVELKEGFQSGIDLRALGRLNGTNELSAQFNFVGDQLSANSTPLAVSYDAQDFDGVIQLLETQGTVSVISSPRISTLNNQKAVFKVGDEQFFLTSANTTSFGAGDQSTTNQNANLQPFFSGIALDVTPQISDEGDIILHIHPILSQVQEDIKIINGSEFPLANSTTRESDSIARAENGEVIVISGLMQTRTRGQESGVPGVKDVPLLGCTSSNPLGQS